jgi:uncharacterized protein YaaN involved in tellurite resistance
MTTSHDVRKLKHDLKVANKIMGKQGETIHRLRAELAEVRALHSKIERGDLRRLEREAQDDARIVADFLKINQDLNKRIKELENPTEAEPTKEYVDQ